MESLKIITRQASKRVAQYAFHYAKLHGRKRVSAIHKANIMKKTDGLFLEVSVCSILLMVFALRTFPIEAVLIFLSVAQLGDTTMGICETMQKNSRPNF